MTEKKLAESAVKSVCRQITELRNSILRTVLIGGCMALSVPSIAQFSSNAAHSKLYTQITSAKDTVYVMLINGIDASTKITYDGNENPIELKWYKYSDLNNSYNDNSSGIPFEITDASGYVLKVSGKSYNVWVIDYKNYLPVVNAITPDASQADECTEVKLGISSSIPSLTYKTPSGNAYVLKREFTLKYATQKWSGDQLSGKWSTDSITYEKIVLPASSYTVKAPLIDTSFRLYGDQYATDLGLSQTSFNSIVYKAVAVECHITTVVSERKEKNEAERPTNSSTVSFSVPFDVEFASNPNLPVATYYKWDIYKDKVLIISRTDKDQRYTFSDYGEYVVKVTVSNATCTYSDSVNVSARIGAALEAPQVFTPDGNGNNDEFRILYKSLLSFECWIYNRWGRLVHHWKDPQKGWDGTIGGKDASEGVYFYVIKASGYGLDPKKPATAISSMTKKGNVTLLRKHD